MKIVAKNWASFQHYKDRAPPWIRLHRSLLDDYDFQCLPVASRALAPMLWLLASEAGDTRSGEIDASPARLAFRLRMSERDVSSALNPLIAAGFFSVVHDASAVLAERVHGAVPETETETETETDHALTCIANSADAEPATNVIPADELEGRRKRTVIACPVARIADLWDEVLPELASPIVWSEARKSAVSARWREMAVFHGWKTQDEGLDWFRRTLVAIRGSPFLMGKVPPRDRNGKPFALTLDWMFGPKNFLKVVEGRYHEQ